MTQHIVDLLIRETSITSREEIMSLTSTGIKTLIIKNREIMSLIHTGTRILIIRSKEIMYQIVTGRETSTTSKDETA